MKIAFLNTGKSYLPEIKAYIKYFNDQDSFLASEVNLDSMDTLSDYDIVWKFTGIDFNKKIKNQLLIHEYNSLSAGRFKRQKDWFKKSLNVKPDGRIFLNENVRRELNFTDGIPYLKRDMGISTNFFGLDKSKKEYDYIYIGTMNASRRIDEVLLSFKENNLSKNILLIGDVPDQLYAQFKNVDNIIFTGRLDYNEIPKVASKAVYGLNFIPDVYPYNIQTSTKLLEYCALGLKVITTAYRWVDQFEKERKASFFKLKNDFSNFNNNEIEKFPFYTPNVNDLIWEKIFDEIKLIDFIKRIK